MNLFAFQVLFPLETHRPGLHEVADVVRRSSDLLTGAHLRPLLERVYRKVAPMLEDAHYGFWELCTDEEEAEASFEQWVEGTQIDADDEADGFVAGAPAYGFVTLLLLLEPESEAAEQFWSVIDQIPEGEEWSRAAFQTLLEMLPELQSDGLRSLVTFVRPGRGGHGVMADLLREEHYHHLSPVL